jgi:hypothetical protein
MGARQIRLNAPHLLRFCKPLADHGIDRRLDKSRRYPLTGPISLAIIDEA